MHVLRLKDHVVLIFTGSGDLKLSNINRTLNEKLVNCWRTKRTNNFYRIFNFLTSYLSIFVEGENILNIILETQPQPYLTKAICFWLLMIISKLTSVKKKSCITMRRPENKELRQDEITVEEQGGGQAHTWVKLLSLQRLLKRVLGILLPCAAGAAESEPFGSEPSERKRFTVSFS